MFKSIEYKLIIYLILLISSVTGSTYFILQEEYVYGGLFIFFVLISLRQLYVNYNKYNKNILFLLNALDNGDYSFNFTEAKLSRRERELNHMMNRIKDILTKARIEAIENEKFTSIIIESVSTGIIILDENNNIKMTNRAVNDLLGLPVFTHLNQLRIIDKSYPELFKDSTPGENHQIKISNEREIVQLSMNTSKISMRDKRFRIITLNNIGNELEAKEMESWIRLIRVMTHEIMNSIAPITSLTDTLLFSHKMTSDTIADKSLRKDTIDALETISHTAKGLITFVQSYRKFTGVPKPEKESTQLNQLINNIINLEKQHLEKHNITLEFSQKNPALYLDIDKNQMTQVLVNLIKNASEALYEEDDAKIKIVVKEENNKVNIDVCNNGKPIPDEIIPNIFIPFFTTKDTGTGIGLSVSRYIMRLHGGNLKYHAADGWTVFSMIF